jgi:hypothetical protein
MSINVLGDDFRLTPEPDVERQMGFYNFTYLRGYYISFQRVVTKRECNGAFRVLEYLDP